MNVCKLLANVWDTWNYITVYELYGLEKNINTWLYKTENEMIQK